MTEKLEIYRCEICGNLVQVLIEGNGTLVCCGLEIKKQEIHHDTSEIGEKHNPKLEEIEGKKLIHVKTHPMTKEHYIQFIQLQTKNKNEIYLKYFYPQQNPQIDATVFNPDLYAIEYCNIHHLWGM